MEPATMTLTQILSSLTEIFTAVIGYVSTVATTITSNPLLLIFVLIPIIGQPQADVKSRKKSGNLSLDDMVIRGEVYA